MRSVALAIVLMLGACTGRDYRIPDAGLPAAWAGADSAVNGEVTGDWWRAFGDPLLDRSVEEALAANPALAGQFSTVREARAMAGMTVADGRPRLDGAVDARRFKDSQELPLLTDGDPHNALQVRFDASWEIDLWGRVARAREAATAEVAAAEWSVADMRVTLCAEVVRAYGDLRTVQRRRSLARRLQACWEEEHRLMMSRRAGGFTDEGEIAAFVAAWQESQRATSELAHAEDLAHSRLAVLRGRNPGAAARDQAADPVAGGAQAFPRLRQALPLGVPADMLRWRPDIRRAERGLAAATARIGVAEADLYPRLRLHGNIGLGAESAGDLLGSKALLWGIGPSLSWNILDAGRTRHGIAAAEARAQGAFEAWRGVVLAAQADVQDAVSAVAATRAAIASNDRAVSSAVAAWKIAKARSALGETDHRPVFAAARHAIALQDQNALLNQRLLNATAMLAKALGHGWSTEDGPAPVAAKEEARSRVRPLGTW